MNMSDILLDGDVTAAAELMRSLGSEARLQILCRLADSELSVNQLAQDCGMSQPSMSQHLKRLKEAGLVKGRRDAQTIYYSIHGREASAILKTLHDLYCTSG